MIINIDSVDGDVWGSRFDPAWEILNVDTSGDFDYYTKVVGDVTSEYRQAGILYKHGDDSVLVLLRYDDTVHSSFQRRDTVDGQSAISNTGLNSASSPAWLRLKRVGSTFTAYYSTVNPTEESDWTELDHGSKELVTLGSDGEIGVMAIHPGSSEFTATFNFFEEWEVSNPNQGEIKMAEPKIAKGKRIYWSPVIASDLVGYRVYWEKAPGELNYETTPFITAEVSQHEVFAPDDFPPDTFEEDVEYNIWVTSRDDAGNESPLSLVGQFDFTPPPAPASGGIESVF